MPRKSPSKKTNKCAVEASLAKDSKRQSPPISPKQCAKGTVREGNDGLSYVRDVRSNGVAFWKKKQSPTKKKSMSPKKSPSKNKKKASSVSPSKSQQMKTKKSSPLRGVLKGEKELSLATWREDGYLGSSATLSVPTKVLEELASMNLYAKPLPKSRKTPLTLFDVVIKPPRGSPKKKSNVELDVTFETSIPVTRKKSDEAVVLFPSEEEERVVEWLESGGKYEDGFEESGALFYAAVPKGTEGFVTLKRTTLHDDYPRVIFSFEPFVGHRDLLSSLHQSAKKFGY